MTVSPTRELAKERTSFSKARALIDKLKASPASAEKLAALLAESAAIYEGRRSDEVSQLRGHILAAFETIELPSSAVPFVYEELESGDNAYTVAAAAKALRGARQAPLDAVPLLLRAIGRFRVADDIVDFGDTCHGEPPVTVLTELFRALAWLGPRAADAANPLSIMADDAASFSKPVRREIQAALAAVSRTDAPVADCCGGNRGEAAHSPPRFRFALDVIQGMEFQDQDGVRITFRHFFVGRPSILTFFYTRCMVPEKCSLTITKLGHLQRAISASHLANKVNVAAVTYDPAFDLPRRLQAYGADRGMIFDERNRLLRSIQGLALLQRYFDLGVSYGDVTVNRHRLELFVLDHLGGVAATFTRAQWAEDSVFAALQTCLNRS